LWRGSQAIKLRPKAFAVLAHLLERPGRLVTKEDLLNGVWPGTFVGDSVLKVAIRQIREALGDDPTSPQFIETAHRRGYRFIGQIAESGQLRANDQEIRSSNAVSGSLLRAANSAQGVVGRDEALSRMRSWLEKSLGGERQIVFVTGEAGKRSLAQQALWKLPQVWKSKTLLLSHNLLGKHKTLSTATHSADGARMQKTKTRRGDQRHPHLTRSLHIRR
jgi:DNA-binding winged helix-turn-helix (wHTH) protein